MKESELDLQYIAADYSYAMIKKAQEKIKNIPDIKTGEHILLDGKDFSLGKEIDQTTYLWLGETMSNYSDIEIIAKFREMGNRSWRDKNYIWFSFSMPPKDNEEREKRIKTYDNPEGKSFRAQGLKNLGLNLEEFDEEIRCDELGTIIIGLVPKEDKKLTLSDGNLLELKKSEFYPYHINKAFSKEQVENLLKKAGCQISFFTAQDGVGLMVANKFPEKLAQHL